MDEWAKTVFVLSTRSKDGMDENVVLSSDIARIAIERAVLGSSEALLVRTGGPSCKSSCCPRPSVPYIYIYIYIYISESNKYAYSQLFSPASSRVYTMGRRPT